MHRGRFLLILLLAAWSAPATAVLGFPSEPSDSWVYPYVYEVRLREPMRPLFVSTAPYRRLDTAGWLEGFSAEAAGERSKWLCGMLKQEYAGESRVLAAGSGWTGDLRIESAAETGSRTRGEALGRFAYYSPLGLAFWTSVRTSANGEGLHKAEPRVWKDRGRASIDYAGIAFRKEGFSLSLSRDEASWGADRRKGLLFSGTAPSLDMITLGYRTGRLAFTSIHSMLRDREPVEEDGGVRRFVSAHRVEVLPTARLSFAISEAVLYGGPNRTFEPVYMNPLTVFYAEQWNSGWNDNILIAGDFAILFPGWAEIRGEIMVDDFQYDFGNEPHEFAAGVSVASVNPLHPRASLFGASYYHVRNQTYGHFISWNRFIHEGKVMGYEDGPDGDRFTLWVTLARPECILWKADFRLRRKGAGRATDVQEETGPRVDFPSGTVEESHRLGLTAAWRPSHMWLLEAGAEYRRVRNAGNVDGADDDGWDLSLKAQFNIKADRWLEE